MKDESLRDKRRGETRASLINAANELMLAKGFLNITMQEVADHAGSHVQTLYSHFPNKYELGAKATVNSLRAALVSRNTDTISFWRAWVEKKARSMLQDKNVESVKFVADYKTETRLAPLAKAISYEYIDILTHNVAADFGLDAKLDLRPKLVAHMLLAASEHAVVTWQEAPEDYDLVKSSVSAVDEVASIVNLVRAALALPVV